MATTDFDFDSLVPDATGYDSGSFDFDSLVPDRIERRSSDALRERLKFNLENDYQEDQGGLLDQALLGIGQGFSGLAGAVGGALSFFGADDTGQSLSDYSRTKRTEYDELGDVLGTSPAAQMTRAFSSQVAGQAPMLAAGLLSGGSLAVMAGAAGLQSLGQIEDEAAYAYQQQGLTRDEAVSKARGPALIGGAITGALTRLFPGGVERLTGDLIRGNVTKGGVGALISRATREALKEYPEEFADEIAQGIVARFTYDPKRPWGEIIQQAHDAGALGVGIGGGAGFTAEGVGRLRGAMPEEEAQDYLSDRQRRADFRSPTTIPEGGRIVQAPGGQARVLDADGNVVGIVDDPTMGVRDVPVADYAPPFQGNMIPEEAAPQRGVPPTQSPVNPANFDFYSLVADEQPEDEQVALPAIPSDDARQGMRMLGDIVGDRGDLQSMRVTAANVRPPSEPSLVQAALVVEQAAPLPIEAAPVPVEALPPEIAPEPTIEQPSDSLDPVTGRAAIGPVVPGAPQSPVMASGMVGIRKVINDSQLKADTKFLANKALDVIEKNGLNTSKLALQIAASLEGGRAGSISSIGTENPISTLIRVAESANERVIPHEVAHLLELTLPEADSNIIEATRLANLPLDAPESIRAGTMTSQEFIDAGLDKSRPELYPFINRSEYLAHFFSEKFAMEQLGKRDAGLLKRIQIWLKELWDAVASKFKDPATAERVYRDLVSGKNRVSPETGLEVEGERASFALNAKDAVNQAELAKDPVAEKFTGEDFIVQTEALAQIVENAGVGTLPFKERQKFFADDFKQILAEGQRLNGPEAAAQVLARSVPSRQEAMYGQAAVHVHRLESKFNDLIADAELAVKELTSTSFQKRIGKMRTQYLVAQLAGNAKAITRAAIQTELQRAFAELKEARGTDMEIAELQAELKGIVAASESTIAMEKLLDDMVATLSVSKNGQLAMTTGTARDVAALYRDIKQSATIKQDTGPTFDVEMDEGGNFRTVKVQPKAQASAPLADKSLISMAGFLLNRNADLRDALLTALYNKNQSHQNQANAAIQGLINRLKKDPARTVEVMMKEREKRQATATGAEFLFFQMQKSLAQDIEDYYNRINSGKIAAEIRVRPDWVAHRNEVYEKSGYFAEKPIDPFKNGLIVIKTPITKREVSIGATKISDSTAETKAAVKEWAAAITEFKSWLANPVNMADMAQYRSHEQTLEVLEDYYNGSYVGTGQKTPAWLSGFGQLKYVIENSGSRLTPGARAVLGKLDILDNRVGAWLKPVLIEMSNAQRKARDSHGLKNMETAQAVKRYDSTVLQELASRNQLPGGPGVGDTLMSGEVVTPEDMAYLKSISKASKALFEVVHKHDMVALKEDRGGIEAYRKELATSEFTMPRAPKLELAKDSDVIEVALAFTNYSQTQTPQTLAALSGAMSKIWDAHGKFLVNERLADFANKTIFDGKGGAFALLADQIRNNQKSFKTYDEFLIALNQFTTLPLEQVRDIVSNEFGRIVGGFYKVVAPEENTSARLIGGDPTNFFTTARSRQLAPSSFYRTGWSTDDDIRGAAGAAVSVGVKRLVDVLKQMLADVESQNTALEKKAEEFTKLGSKDSVSAVKRMKAVAQRNGQAYSDWSALDKRIKMLKNAIANIENAKIIGDSGGWQRVGSALISSLIGNTITTLRNTAPVYPYRAMKAAGASELDALMNAFGFSTLQTAKIVGSFAYGVPRAAYFGLKGMYEGIDAGIQEKSVRVFWKKMMGGIIRELGNATPERLQAVRAMIADGLYQIPDAEAQFDAQMADIFYKGALPSAQASKWDKAGMGVAATFEITIGAVVNSIFPLAGDAATNSTLWISEHSKFGTNAVYGQKIRGLIDTWNRSKTAARPQGYRTFDLTNPNSPENALSYGELGITANQLAGLRQTFSWMGRSFDAAVADYMARLKADPKAQFLNDQDISKIVEYHINNANRKSYGNANMWLNSHPITKAWIAPLLHWSARQFSEWAASLSIATEGQQKVNSFAELQKSQLALFGQMMTFAIISMATAGAVSAQRDDWIGRMIRYALYRSTSQNKQIWEYKDEKGDFDLSGATQRGVGLAIESVPFLSWAGTLLLPQNTPARASFDPGLVMVNKAMELANGIRKLAVTGDIEGTAFDLARGFLPQDTRILTSRLPSQEGRLERSNMLNLMKRFGPGDITRPRDNFRASNPNLSELSPYGPRLVNAAFAGSDREIRDTFKEAVAVARKIGREDPERSAAQLFINANPTLIAFKQTPTRAQYERMLRNMDDAQRKQFNESKRKLDRASAVLGLPEPRYWKDEDTTRSSLRNRSERVGLRAR